MNRVSSVRPEKVITVTKKTEMVIMRRLAAYQLDQYTLVLRPIICRVFSRMLSKRMQLQHNLSQRQTFMISFRRCSFSYTMLLTSIETE